MAAFSSSNCWCWAERSVITLCDRKGPNKTNIARISGHNLSKDHLWVLRIQSLLCLKVWYFAPWMVADTSLLSMIYLDCSIAYIFDACKIENGDEPRLEAILTTSSWDKRQNCRSIANPKNSTLIVSSNILNGPVTSFSILCCLCSWASAPFSRSSLQRSSKPWLAAQCKAVYPNWPELGRRSGSIAEVTEDVLARRVEALTQLPRLNRSGTTLIICIHLWRLRWKWKRLRGLVCTVCLGTQDLAWSVANTSAPCWRASWHPAISLDFAALINCWLTRPWDTIVLARRKLKISQHGMGGLETVQDRSSMRHQLCSRKSQLESNIRMLLQFCLSSLLQEVRGRAARGEWELTISLKRAWVCQGYSALIYEKISPPHILL